MVMVIILLYKMHSLGYIDHLKYIWIWNQPKYVSDIFLLGIMVCF